MCFFFVVVVVVCFVVVVVVVLLLFFFMQSRMGSAMQSIKQSSNQSGVPVLILL